VPLQGVRQGYRESGRGTGSQVGVQGVRQGYRESGRGTGSERLGQKGAGPLCHLVDRRTCQTPDCFYIIL